jgi:hypothetical protein
VTHVVVDEEVAPGGDSDDIGACPLELLLWNSHRDQALDPGEGLQEADELDIRDQRLQSFGPGTTGRRGGTVSLGGGCGDAGRLLFQ